MRRTEDLDHALELDELVRAARAGHPLPAGACMRSGLQRRLGPGGGGRRFGRDPNGGRPRGGPSYLLDYFAGTVARATSAANQDPRIAWAFQNTGDWHALQTWPADITSWTDTGTPTEVTGVTDHLGGTTAVTTGDDDAAGYEYHAHSPGVATMLGVHRFDIPVKKDTDETRFPELLFTHATGTLGWQINTKTGATAIRTETGWGQPAVISCTTHPDNPDWWLCRTILDPTSSGGFSITVIPARSTTLGGLNVAATGTLTWVPTIAEEVSAAWKLSSTHPDATTETVARIFGDGALLLEGARTTQILRSSQFDLGSWAKTGVTVTADTADGPDGSGSTADTLTFPAVATDEISQGMSGTADGETWTVSGWFKTAFGTKQFRIGVLQRDGTTYDLSANLTATTDWQRFSYTASTGTGASAARMVIRNDSGGAAGDLLAWNAQAEDDGGTARFATSDVRTTTATATRNADQLDFAPGTWGGKLADGKFTFKLWTTFDSTQTPAPGGVAFLIGASSGVWFLRLRWTGAAWNLDYQADGFTVEGGTQGATFTAGTEYTMEVDHTIGQATCAALGGTPRAGAGAPRNWDTADTLRFTGLGAVLSRPRAA